jgi:hypothetical protein
MEEIDKWRIEKFLRTKFWNVEVATRISFDPKGPFDHAKREIE